MKIINRTHFVTADLRKILLRCADMVLREDKRNRATVAIVYGKKGGSSGCASVGGFYAKVRISKHHPQPDTFAWVAIHEFRHLNGWTHRDMPATYSLEDARKCSWANDMPLRIKEPKRKPRPTSDDKLAAARANHARALTRLKRAQTIEKKWRVKVRYYERKQLSTALPIAAGGPS